MKIQTSRVGICQMIFLNMFKFIVFDKYLICEQDVNCVYIREVNNLEDFELK